MFKKVVALLLFVVFVPGVVFTFPPKGDRMLVLVTHALLFVLVSHVVFHALRETFGNHGPTCPNGFMMLPDKSCVPVGRQTYDPASKLL